MSVDFHIALNPVPESASVHFCFYPISPLSADVINRLVVESLTLDSESQSESRTDDKQQERCIFSRLLENK
jgi:hypothetical protein